MNTKAQFTTQAAVLAATLMLGSLGVLAAQPVVELDEAAVVRSEVLAIDYAHRLITVVGPREEILEMHVGDEVRNFDQINVGDEIVVRFYQSVAMYIGKPGTQPKDDASAVVARAPEGGKPGGYAIGAVDVSAEVMGIDAKNRSVMLKLPDGHTVSHKVDKSVQGFDQLRVGDVVTARVTRAIAISVESP